MLDINKTYIEFNEDCLDYVIDNKEDNTLFIKAVITELTTLYNHDKNIFINDILRKIGGKEIVGGWNYGLMKGKSISPDELTIDYSGDYIKIYLNGFRKVDEDFYNNPNPNYIKEKELNHIQRRINK